MLIKPARSFLIAALLTYHALAVTLGTMVPADSSLHAAIDPLFRGYLSRSGSEQTWSMFTSAPYYASYRVVLVAEDADGATREYGPVLPGLRPYDDGTYRDHKLFGALAMPGYAEALAAYFERARAEIQAQDGIHVRSLKLRFDTQRLYNVARVRQDDVVSFPEVTATEPRRWTD
jgi:hypothetical protein